MTMISLIAAMSRNRVIGKDNRLPWRIPEELAYFKAATMGKPMIMGRKTFDAIGRRLLPGRSTIVLTRDTTMQGEGFSVANTPEEALLQAGDVPEVMIIGGACVYKEFLPRANRIYLSVISDNYEGDAYFPELDLKKWQLISELQHEKFVAKTFERETS